MINRMLDILEKFLIRKGYCFSRLDGSTPTGLRQSLVDDFNSSPSKQVFLISTRAGGLGLNLVSANRVVIFDPNWNPAQDLQAQDRSFRYGQKRHVVVFRLLAAGSLEELIYTRQVYKQQLSNIAVSGRMEKRYFEGVQDCKEFQGELFGICNLFRDLSDKLFTSEIIELHEKQGPENGHHPGGRQDLVELGMYFVPLQDGNETSSRGSETSRPKDSQLTSKPVLSDLGIMYAHRNEDVVNSGPGTLWQKELGMPRNDGLDQPHVPIVRKKSDRVCGKENTSSKSTKKGQYTLLAQFMNMGEMEFSEWLLSASPADRERVLRDYKRRKEKTPAG
ncbi:Swi5 complex subunit Swi2 [Sarracenia purpurea var. burkii]